jgi:transcriptional regulator with XRE-family HTH domain
MPNQHDDADAMAYLLLPWPDVQIVRAIEKHAGTVLSVRTVEGWKGGRSLPRVELLEAIAKAIDIPVREVRDAYSRAKFTRRKVTAARKERLQRGDRNPLLLQQAS